MVNYWFNHAGHEKLNIEHLANNHGLFVEFRLTKHQNVTISVEKGGVIITKDPLKTNVVVLKDEYTDSVYVIPVKDILNIRIFNP